MAAFVDTNILLYALSSANEGQTEKVSVARQLVAGLMEQNGLILSVQVLSEFIAVAMRKGSPPLVAGEVAAVIKKLLEYTVLPIDAALVESALRRMQTSRISYWDALIVEAAIRSGASVLYTEDLHNGTFYDGLEVRNPFVK
jgi:predicted nucleic acid-binding protein